MMIDYFGRRLYPAVMRAEPPSRAWARNDAATRTWSRYRANSARHLIGISRDLQSRLMRALGEERGFQGLRPSLGPLLSLLWVEGRPLTAIASQLAISPQACTQLANLAEAAGYLERKPDPEDRRSKLVLLTRRGRELVEAAVEIILEVETEYAELVGPRAYQRFASSLAALYQGLRIPTHANPALTAAAGRSAGVLPLIAVRIQQQLMEATIGRGHTGLKLSHGQVLPLIGPRGGRVYEIARLQRMSRQAISATARDLEALGYLRREVDARDRRGGVLQLTTRGSRLIRDSLSALDALERSFSEILGNAKLAHVRHVARDLYQSLHLEQSIFEAASTPQIEAIAPQIAIRREDAAIERLATRLRHQLGDRDAERLATLLASRVRRTA